MSRSALNKILKGSFPTEETENRYLLSNKRGKKIALAFLRIIVINYI